MIFRFLMITIFIVLAEASRKQKTCSKNICDVLSKIDEQGNKCNVLHEFLSNSPGHIQSENDMEIVTLPTNCNQFQKLLRHDMETLLGDHEVYITQVVKDLEIAFTKKITVQMLNVAHGFVEVGEIMKNKLEDYMQNLTATLVNEIKKTDNKKESQKFNEHINQCSEHIDGDKRPSDCLDVLNRGNNESGVYIIHPSRRVHNCGIKVFCDMDTDGGGWTVFLLRNNQTIPEYFNRNWYHYRDGFGVPPNEYWLGNEALHQMTSFKDYSLRIEAMGPGNPKSIWEEWSTIRVASEDLKFKLTMDGYNKKSTIYNNYGFDFYNGQYFSTKDRDNDKDNENCAVGRSGGFWYNNCSKHRPTSPVGKIRFYGWSKSDSSVKYATHVQMKIRPK